MMTAEQLKCSIYQQIFSGKLTQQLREDGSTKALIDSIEKTVPKTTKIARIEKQEDGLYYERLGNKKVLISDELPFDIPDNWEWVHLNKVAVSGLGKTLNKSKDTGETKQYLCSINVYWDGIHLEEVKKAKFSDTDIVKYKLQKGDLLICEGGDAGRTAIWNNDTEMYYQNALHRVRFYEGIDPYYFCALMEFYKLNGTIDSYCKGMTIKHLVQGSLNAMYFPLPPLAEQKRIVAKIKELMPFMEQYAAASTKLNTLNTTFPDMMKKSILQEAVQGKLVPQDPNDEPASVLLRKISQKCVIPTDLENEINNNYNYAHLVDVCLGIYDCPHSTPTYSDSFKGYLCLRTRELEVGEIKWDKLLYLTEDTYKERVSRYMPQKGDIVYAREGRYGICAVIDRDTPLALGQRIMVFSVNREILRPKYLFYTLISDFCLKQVISAQRGMTAAHVNVKDIKKMIIPIPSLKNQDAIINMLDTLLSKVDYLKGKING